MRRKGFWSFLSGSISITQKALCTPLWLEELCQDFQDVLTIYIAVLNKEVASESNHSVVSAPHHFCVLICAELAKLGKEVVGSCLSYTPCHATAEDYTTVPVLETGADLSLLLSGTKCVSTLNRNFDTRLMYFATI